MPESPPLSTLAQSIVRTLAYFDLFNYPLRKDEVYFNLQTNHVTETEVTEELQRLREAKVLFQTGEFFSLQNNQALVSRRIAGNKKAEGYKGIAARRARWIYQFPFVRAVMISGSLSKNYADEKTDIDFFIITAPHRLWVARTLLVLFKRIFLLNSHKYFCVNYFIDEEHLEIEEKNLFTATELSTLVPLQGLDLYHRFIGSNAWVREMLPHTVKKITETGPGEEKEGLLKRSLEKVLASGLGRWLEKKFMRVSQFRWQRHYRNKLSPEDFEIAFKSTAYVSKNHPENYQRKVMERYRAKLEEFSLGYAPPRTHE